MTDATHREVPQKSSSVLKFRMWFKPENIHVYEQLRGCNCTRCYDRFEECNEFCQNFRTRILNMLFYVICVKVQWIDDVGAFLIVDTQ